MPFARKDFDEINRYLDVYSREVGVSDAAVDVTTTEGERLCVLKILDVTENTVTFLVFDEEVGIAPLGGNEKQRHRRAIVVPHDHIRSMVFGPLRGKDPRMGFTR
jgi:hypothetical protein